jgi:hypothetical protein
MKSLASSLGEKSAAQSDAAPDSFFLSRWLFLRLLGVVYLAAFLSLWVQIKGLIGAQGILPVRDYLPALRKALGFHAYYLAPTLCWLDPSDALLTRLCVGGVVLAGLLIAGIAPAVILFLLWIFYLSLTVTGQIFLGYQWDGLLLETGFLAIFFAPVQLWPRLSRERPPPVVVLWLLRWLLFRLMFLSGAVKLISGDATWRSLAALTYHYETQPLPTWTSWYMHQLPALFQCLSVLFTFLVELILPALIFGTRRCRQVAFAGIVSLQLLIAATGNYGFFNLLTIALCLPLLDDRALAAPFRLVIAGFARIQIRMPEVLRIQLPPVGSSRRRGRWVALGFGGFIVLFSFLSILARFGLITHKSGRLFSALQAVHSFHSINAYGLFAIMTTSRPEIIVEGSNDGTTWLPYEFKWKPGDVQRVPAFTGLHMPRLDWQMWFAALDDYEANPWFSRFLARLLEGSPDVLSLLETNPFPEKPRFVRAVLYDYHFTSDVKRNQTGAYWQRRLLGAYSPVLSLRQIH